MGPGWEADAGPAVQRSDPSLLVSSPPAPPSNLNEAALGQHALSHGRKERPRENGRPGNVLGGRAGRCVSVDPVDTFITGVLLNSCHEGQCNQSIK